MQNNCTDNIWNGVGGGGSDCIEDILPFNHSYPMHWLQRMRGFGLNFPNFAPNIPSALLTDIGLYVRMDNLILNNRLSLFRNSSYDSSTNFANSTNYSVRTAPTTTASSSFEDSLRFYKKFNSSDKSNSKKLKLYHKIQATDGGAIAKKYKKIRFMDNNKTFNYIECETKNTLREGNEQSCSLSTKASSTAAATITTTMQTVQPPKKKWIRHYLMANGNGATTATHNGNIHNVLAAATEDSSQSSLNLSSSGYLSGSSVNSGGGCGPNLNLSVASLAQSGGLTFNGGGDQQMALQSHATSGRRRTISSNSNGAGTREVHNKLEKDRRAHLKECFEKLKIQLQLKDEEKKKTSNLAILGAACRHVRTLRSKEKDLEHEVEQLAKDKINAQKKIVSLKRELETKYNVDISSIITEVEMGNIPMERESLSDSVSLSSGRGSMRYSSSSSLSSGGNTTTSPLGGFMQSAMPNTMSPVISSTNNSQQQNNSNVSPNNSPNQKTSSPLAGGSSMPLPLTAKNISATSLTRGSPTPSTPSPSPSSSGVSSSSSIISSSPPNGINMKVPNIPNGVKIHSTVGGSSSASISLVSTSANGVNTLIHSPVINITGTDSNGVINNLPNGLNITPQSIHVSQANHNVGHHTPKDLSGSLGKNGISRKKTSSFSECRDSSSPPSHVIFAKKNSSFGCNKDHMEDGEQPPKVIKVYNGIALAPVDKDNKILSTGPLLQQVVGGGNLVVSPFPMLSQPLRVIGTNGGLATIELSPQQQQQSRVSTPQMTTTTATGAQLHKLLVSGGTTMTSNTFGTNGMITHSSELGRLPGGAELNILPTATNGTTTLYRGNGKLAIVNNGITLKGAETSSSGRAVHVVTQSQSGPNTISGLTPIVVSQGQQGNNLAHLIASSPQLAGKVNLSVGGQALPLFNAQYLKPMVVVASSANPTLSSVPPMQTTSALAATGTTNGNVS